MIIMQNKIETLIKQNNIRPSDCSYHTWRDVANKNGKRTGKIRVLVLKVDQIARCEYICPECGYENYEEKPWKRPFSINCTKCNFLIRVSRMRDEVKRERKMEKL